MFRAKHEYVNIHPPINVLVTSLIIIHCLSSLCLGDHRYKGKSNLGADEQQITAFPDVKETEITE